MVNLIVNQLIMKAPIHVLDKEQLHVSAEWVPNHLLAYPSTNMAITVPCAWDGHATGLP
jgi:hypothetical protein